MSVFKVITAVAGVLFAGGCTGVERTLTVESEPPGALVYLNDQEVGRTPMTREFTWYGTYDLALRREGYETLKARAPVIAPWWQWVPFDFVAEVLPLRLRDRHRLSYTMKPTTEQNEDPQQMIRRGEELRSKLISGEKAKTRPTTRPLRQSTTRPSSREAR